MPETVQHSTRAGSAGAASSAPASPAALRSRLRLQPAAPAPPGWPLQSTRPGGQPHSGRTVTADPNRRGSTWWADRQHADLRQHIPGPAIRATVEDEIVVSVTTV